MRVPMSWLRPLVPDLTATVEEVATALVRAGLEVEQVHRVGHEISAVVVGRVLDVEELTEFKKPIRFCHVDVGTAQHEVVCGAQNFAPGDLVPFALPGAELPGGFHIATRQTYGHTSDGMICSAAELGLAGDADGILRLETGELGDDVVALLGLRDEVLDIAITPDRGYTLSMRGIAREVATAFDLALVDPGLGDTDELSGGPVVRIQDPGCDRYVARLVHGLDPAATSPAWLQRRLVLAGMRPVSLAVDVTNHVMLETGQPLHAFDADRLHGDIVVRRARAGERLTTLDGTDRALDTADLVIADDTGALALAGVMGGASTEVTDATTTLLVESAHFAARSITLTARRHRLPSEASKRFERGVDVDLAAVAAQRAVDLLVELGGASAGPGRDVDDRVPPVALTLPVGLPGRLAGRHYDPAVVVQRLVDVGCHVEGDDPLLVTPPSWRPDLTGQAELVEEVVRLEGYDTVPLVLPTAPAGSGLTTAQRLRRNASRALAAAGLVEVVLPPFVGADTLATLGLAHLDPPRVLNPLSEQEAMLRPSLLPGLLTALLRNTSRGLSDVGIFETGSVFLGTGAPVAEVPKTTQRPTDEQLAGLDAALPAQPRHAGVAVTAGRGGVGAVVEVVLAVARSLGVQLVVARGDSSPFHPGRCAALLLDGVQVGVAGELHPRVVAALGLPERVCAGEVDLDALVAAAPGAPSAPVVSTYPPATVDVALVVADAVLAAEVESALRAGAGELLEDLRLFDVYTGQQVADGHRSLAYALRLRAPDRTLTDVEVLGARDAAIAEAGTRTGATLR